MQEPITLESTAAQNPDFLLNEVDSRITRLRPMATPLDQISRYAGARQVNNMTVEYYAVAMRQFETTVASEFKGGPVSATSPISLKVENVEAIETSETIMMEGLTTADKDPLVFYVAGIDRLNSAAKVIPVSIQADMSGRVNVPAIPAGTKVIRMGRAAAELDVQTGQYDVIPTKSDNYCQIFKTQIEESTLLGRADKQVPWTFSDREQVAIYDMRLGMERSFLFGHKAKINDPDKKSEVYLTGGIWKQAGKQVSYVPGQLTSERWLEMMSTMFTGHEGSNRKVLIAGTDLITALSKMTLDDNRRVLMPEHRVSRWGLDFTELVSKFGTLYVIHSEVLDSCGHAADGIVIDPEYLTKYVHTPFKADTLDLRTSGQRNTQAVVLTEISCLVLRYPDAHCRIIANPAANEANAD